MILDQGRSGDPRRELAAALRELRRRAGLTGDRLAARCNISQSKISRIETGKTLPSLIDVERILRAVGAPRETVDQVCSLARTANTEWQNLRSLRRKGLDAKQAELAGLEASSSRFRFFLLSMLTGMLSTPECIRATLAHLKSERENILTRKLGRQQILYDEQKSFDFVLTEQAVRWPLIPGPAMAVQIDHLISLSRLPNVRIGVMPLGKTAPVTALDTFTIYDRSLVTVETTTGIIVLRDFRDVTVYLDLFAALEEHARFDDAGREHLSAWAEECRR